MTEPGQPTSYASIDSAIGRKQDTWLSLLFGSQAFWVFVAIICLGAYVQYRTGVFLSPKNIYNITRNATFVAIIALGMTFVIISGGIDLSVGSVLVMSSMVCAVTMHAGYGIEIGILAALTASLLVGLVNGTLIAYFGYPPFVVTLAMMSIARSLAMIISNNQTVFQFGPDHDRLLAFGGGGITVPIPTAYLQSLLGIPTAVIAYPVIYTLVLACIVGFVLRYTRFGRHVFAIGGNEKAAELTGVPVRPIKVAVYMICALAAGMCGVIETGWLGAVTTNLGTGMELQVIAATVIGGANLAGGAGTAVGALVGAGLIEVIRNSQPLLGINAFWQGTIVGCFIVIAVTFERIKNARGSD